LPGVWRLSGVCIYFANMTAASSDPLSLGYEGAGMVLVQVLESDKHPLVRKAHMI
jgi:hypothetical protein